MRSAEAKRWVRRPAEVVVVVVNGSCGGALLVGGMVCVCVKSEV